MRPGRAPQTDYTRRAGSGCRWDPSPECISRVWAARRKQRQQSPVLVPASSGTSKWDIVRNFVLLGLFGFEMFEILWVLELLTGAPYWDSE